MTNNNNSATDIDPFLIHDNYFLEFEKEMEYHEKLRKRMLN